jgi:hypothetical protein
MRLALRVFTLLLAGALTAQAQGTPPVERLPENTVFFVSWHGLGAIERARATNSLLRLWNDVEFQGVLETLMSGAERRAEKAANRTPETDAKSREQMASFFSLASNPVILGFSGAPAPPTKPAAAAGGDPAAPPRLAPSNVFIIFDATGKADLLKKLDADSRARATEKPTITTSRFSGVEISRLETSRRVSYEAWLDRYFIYTERKEVMEQLIPRFQGPAPASSVLSTAAYQAVKAHQAPDSFLEFFGRIPDVDKMEIPPSLSFNAAAMLKALHLERLQAIGGSASVAGEGTRVRAVVLGDTAPGSFFDVIGENSPTFSTLAAAPAGAAYQAMRLDLGAFYKTLRAAVVAALPPEQAATADLVEGMAGTQLGMGLHEALALISGEFAVISTGESAVGLDPLNDVYALAIQKPEEFLKLLRLILTTNITSETNEGSTTFLAMTTPYRDPKTGVQRSRFQYIAVAPQVAMMGPRRTQLKEMLARYAQGAAAPPAGSLAADPAFQAVRARLAPSLTGIQYADLSRMPLNAIVEQVMAQAREQARTGEPLSDQEVEAMKSLPGIIARYLRRSFGGWTKERNGLFVDSFIE